VKYHWRSEPSTGKPSLRCDNKSFLDSDAYGSVCVISCAGEVAKVQNPEAMFPYVTLKVE
jgi:hypothetical protein